MKVLKRVDEDLSSLSGKATRRKAELVALEKKVQKQNEKMLKLMERIDSALERIDELEDLADSAYLTPPTALLSIGAIEEITGVSRTVMFPDGYSERLSSGVEDDDAVTRSFHSMAVGFPRLEEFGDQGPLEVGRWRRIVVSATDRLSSRTKIRSL